MMKRRMAIGAGVALMGALLSGGGTLQAATVQGAAVQVVHVNGQAAVKTALQYLGTPYAEKGTQPATGFDDVGFVRWVYAQQGINLPPDLTQLRLVARRLHVVGLHSGHLIFFKNTVWSGLSHVGIYIGNGMFVHAEWYGYGVVKTYLVHDPVDGDYWKSHYLGHLNPSALPSSPGAPTVALGSTATVRGNSVNLRSEPSFRSTVIGVLGEGASLTVIAVQHGWVNVTAPGGHTGWVYARFLSVS